MVQQKTEELGDSRFAHHRLKAFKYQTTPVALVMLCTEATLPLIKDTTDATICLTVSVTDGDPVLQAFCTDDICHQQIWSVFEHGCPVELDTLFLARLYVEKHITQGLLLPSVVFYPCRQHINRLNETEAIWIMLPVTLPASSIVVVVSKCSASVISGASFTFRPQINQLITLLAIITTIFFKVLLTNTSKHTVIGRLICDAARVDHHVHGECSRFFDVHYSNQCSERESDSHHSELDVDLLHLHICRFSNIGDTSTDR